MFAILPSAADQLSEPTSIALVQSIQQQAILTPLSQQAIATSYVHQGSGTPILLLHGFDSSVLEFRRLLPLLATHNETWACDLLGFGFTERMRGISFSPAAIKTHLYSFWKTLINQPVILVGASMGGAAAIDFTLTYPQSVKKLALINSVGCANGPAAGRFLFPPLGYLAAELLRHPKVRERVTRNAYHDQTLVSLDAQHCAALHLKMPGWHQAMIAFTKAGGYGALLNRLSQINQPTLILWGEADRILGTRDAKTFQHAIAHSQLIWVKDCGHVPHLEQPQVTAEHILEFSRETSR
jgi:pimeloyl-ACP methyl ester carboxylesterase